MADIKHYLLRYSFNQMEKGYGEEAKNVLRYISLYISEGISLPEDINNYLVEALDAIANGEKPQKALKLNGRKKKITIDTDIELATKVHYLICDGYTFTEASNLISNTDGKSYEHIRKAYYEYKDGIEENERLNQN